MDGKVKTYASLPEVRFDNPRLLSLGIEFMTMTALRGKVAAKRLHQPERVDFYLLMLVTEGSGLHTIDFIDWVLSPGKLIFVQPGQVQQWHPDNRFEALMILIDPSALPHNAGQVFYHELGRLGFDEWPTWHTLNADCLASIEAGFRQIRQDFDKFSGEAIDIALIRYELMALLTRIAKLQTQGRDDVRLFASSRLTYRLFIQMLEASFTRERTLYYYSRRLGYSESTITRACVAAEGRSAKEVISRRVLLEAKRMLVHSTASVSTVAYQLGFSEATNFVKFFRRYEGLTPKTFRDSILSHS